jgi:non-heme chloroperoxidase
MPSIRKITLASAGAAAAAAAVAGGAIAYRRRTTVATGEGPPGSELGWGDLEQPADLTVDTPDGASLAVWDVGQGPAVVLPHCWGCTHAIWVPVARRLVESGHRVVLYDQRGHGASTRGTAPLSIQALGDDLAAVLSARDVDDAVLAGHSMGGMTIMALATYRPEVLQQRGRALVLVATAAASFSTGPIRAERVAAGLIASPVVARALRSPNGYRFVRGTFGVDPVRAHVDLTAKLFAECAGEIRGGFLSAMSAMQLLEGIATIAMPVTVMVGSQDRLTPPSRAAQMVATIPGARLVTLEGRGHMLPLEDPDAVADEIVRAVKG